MKVAILAVACLAAAGAQPISPKFTCGECIQEMHQLGWLVKYAAEDIHDFLVANYCPTTGDPSCPETLSWHYVGMLNAVVNHFIVDGAVHICQTMMECGARRYTCEDCIYGLEYVERYLEDDIMINEMVVYLQQNFCLSEWENCKEEVRHHFAAMHRMTMEKFFIPTDICMQEPVCGASPPTKPPTKPPQPNFKIIMFNGF